MSRGKGLLNNGGRTRRSPGVVAVVADKGIEELDFPNGEPGAQAAGTEKLELFKFFSRGPAGKKWSSGVLLWSLSGLCARACRNKRWNCQKCVRGLWDRA